MKRFGTFGEAISNTKFEIYRNSSLVAPRTWQSVDVTARPEMVTHEVKWWGLRVPIDTADTVLAYLRDHIKPNVPWADNHFEERVSGQPLNPGVEWANWPYSKSADTFRKDGMFNHSYAERYWPKYATRFGPIRTVEDAKDLHPTTRPHRGIRYEYGDLMDVVNQLGKDPLTRQAILPVFFPEDTGAVHGDRVPCSIFYQFMVRDDKLDLFYYLRSCDFVRHFRDDIYLTVRLQLWVIDQLYDRHQVQVSPGDFLMQIGSLHIFRNDWEPLFKEPYKR